MPVVQPGAMVAPGFVPVWQPPTACPWGVAIVPSCPRAVITARGRVFFVYCTRGQIGQFGCISGFVGGCGGFCEACGGTRGGRKVGFSAVKTPCVGVTAQKF